MDSPSDSQKSSKHNIKATRKQIKVVYISNPMKVKTTAAEFKGLVQELTGRDSHLPRGPPPPAEAKGATDEVQREPSEHVDVHDGGRSLEGADPPRPLQRVLYTSNWDPFDMLNEVFIPHIPVDLSPLVPSPSDDGSPPPPAETPGAWA